jgi:Domain of unknown function (DUF4129)
MQPIPIQPTQTPPEDRGGNRRPGARGSTLSPAQWLKQHVLFREEQTITSLGELLLPSLLGVMEACWVDAALIGLASMGLLDFSTPLLPLWAPFVYIVGFQWILALREHRAASAPMATEENNDGKLAVKIPDAPLLFSILAALSLLIIWLQIYAPARPLYDLTWLAMLGSDMLFLNIHFYQAIFIVAFSCYLCWRGLRLLNQYIEPSHVIRVLLLGLGVIIAAVLLRAALESSGTPIHDTVFLFLLIPVFLFFSLAAHALARIVFVRKSHFTGLQGSVVAQERAVITVIASLGMALLLVTVLVGLMADPAFFSGALRILIPVGMALANAYNWLVNIFAYIIVFLATPVFWLISLLASLLPRGKSTSQKQPIKQPQQKLVTHPALGPDTAAWLPYLRAGVLLLLLLACIGLLWWAIRRRRKASMRVLRKDEDIHESLWSWLLLWSQLRNILRALFGRFFHRAARAGEQAQVAPEDTPGDPAARDIRAIYRALLKKAAGRGFQRKKDETPLELRQRLDENVPLVEPQLETITAAYSLVRYGGSLPDAEHVTLVQEQWRELDQKWV